jgi:hypothetical protein
MTPDQAASLLDKHLRKFPWYLSTGVGRTIEGDALFVYVKSAKHRELNSITPSWQGYRVVVRPVGSIRALDVNSKRLVTSH